MKGHILKMLPHCLTVSQVVISMNEAFVESFPLGTSHHFDLNGTSLSKRSHNGLLRVKRYLDRLMAPAASPGPTLSGRELHQPCPLQTQQEFSTGHRLEHAVSLTPIPETAEFLGDECPASGLMFLDNGADEDDIITSDPSAPDNKLCIHGLLYIA
jgi:hypothetical protein